MPEDAAASGGRGYKTMLREFMLQMLVMQVRGSNMCLIISGWFHVLSTTRQTH